jgi:STE24 endopeptidase
LNESKATRYQRLRRRSQLISLAAGFGLLVLVTLTGASHRLAAIAAGIATSFPPSMRDVAAAAIFVGVLTLVAEAVALPLALMVSRGSRRSKRADGQSAPIAASQIRDALVGAVIAVGAAVLLRVAMATGGPWWWVLAAVMLATSTLAAIGLLSLGMAWSGETRPLSRQSLVAPLSALSERACGRPVAVREWEPASGPAATAMVTGVGRAGAVLLSTEMVRDWAEDEIVVVVAHELSHHAHHDLARKVALDAVLWCVALALADRAVAMWGPRFGVSGAADLAALPLLTLVSGAFWCLLRPLRLAQSRAHERRADAFALSLTGNLEAFGRALRRLGEAHLAEERPSRLTRWFFHRHPTVEERLSVSARRR